MGQNTPEYTYTAAGLTNPSVQVGLYAVIRTLVAENPSFRRVCDLGCGNGSFALSMAQMAELVVGVDSSTSGIEVANRNATGKPNISFIQSAINCELAGRVTKEFGEFDAVVSIDVIEHLYMPRTLIEASMGVLRPGGLAFICTPYHGYLKNLLISIAGRWDSHHGVDWDGGHIKFFSPSSLERMVKKCGLVDVRFKYFGRVPYLWKNMICIARKPSYGCR